MSIDTYGAPHCDTNYNFMLKLWWLLKQLSYQCQTKWSEQKRQKYSYKESQKTVQHECVWMQKLIFVILSVAGYKSTKYNGWVPPCKLWRHRKKNPQKSILKLSDVYAIITGPTKGGKRINPFIWLWWKQQHWKPHFKDAVMSEILRTFLGNLNFPIGSFLFWFE